MASSLNLLQSYGSDSENSNDSGDTDEKRQATEAFVPAKIDPSLSIMSSIVVESAPLVLYSVSLFGGKCELW